MLPDRVLEARHPVEREEPDPQREHVVAVERRREERVVRAPVDVPVDPLVDIDQEALVGGGQPAELVDQRDRLLAVGGGRSLSREPRRG